MNATNQCAEMELLIQADIDGELRAAEAVSITAHRATCAHCEQTYRQLMDLKQSLRNELERHTASADFRALLQRKIAAETKAATPVKSNPVIKLPNKANTWYKRSISTFGAGAALAAGLAFFIVSPAQEPLLDAVVAEHIRSLQPGHLLDVESNDQHNVKPWFDGRLDFAPPVRNFSAQGFPLAGGRLDYLNGREVAALVYLRGKHSINLFVWPEAAEKSTLSASEFQVRNGYNSYRWHQSGMAMWIVSDLNQSELSDFVKLWDSTKL
ncbi:MAG: anti-sigma factor [Verrucomicrobiaceae bacterium]|nr:anti-sigma factor [Verrucomicrobiaceae bacterium]